MPARRVVSASTSAPAPARRPIAAATDPPDRRPPGRAVAAAKRPHALLLLGQVRQLEECAERASKDLKARRVERRQLGVQGQPIAGIVASSERDGEAAHALDQVQGAGPFLLRDHLSQQGAQQADLAGERVAGVGRTDRARFGSNGRVAGWPDHFVSAQGRAA
jgi:hypothetical protein